MERTDDAADVILFEVGPGRYCFVGIDAFRGVVKPGTSMGGEGHYADNGVQTQRKVPKSSERGNGLQRSSDGRRGDR